MPPPKKPRRSQDLPPRKVLACPYWKLDPTKYRKCLKLESFWEVNRVKQHLTRKHLEPEIFCDMCKKPFHDEAAKVRHLQEDRVTCVYEPWAERLITRRQQGELHKKSKADTERDKWFDVWDILFPGIPRPSSPFIDERVSDDFRLFREYAGHRGRAVLLEQLRAAGFNPPSASSPPQDDSMQEFLSQDALETYRLEAVERALEFFMDDFLSMSSSPSSECPASERGNSMSAPESSGRATPASSFADSGMDLNPSLNLPLDLDPGGGLDDLLGDGWSSSEFDIGMAVTAGSSLDLFGDDQIQFSGFCDAVGQDGFCEGLGDPSWSLDPGQGGER
ncbi:hypothetical protein QBC47DRAFT_432306 [Echria macrotheca]|uniref:C2H2-type domain-containing protein n=1 Tax=Echria macrotheca TaxID=438768 RepID=A0AAJ0B6M5_9PEZI|nr:hypothetical protein QBC47DRAFT_432306 [Echria macrotheca]